MNPDWNGQYQDTVKQSQYSIKMNIVNNTQQPVSAIHLQMIAGMGSFYHQRFKLWVKPSWQKQVSASFYQNISSAAI